MFTWSWKVYIFTVGVYLRPKFGLKLHLGGIKKVLKSLIISLAYICRHPELTPPCIMSPEPKELSTCKFIFTVYKMIEKSSKKI